MIIDLSNSPLKENPEEVIRQIQEVYKSKDYTWLKEIIITADEKVQIATIRV